MDLSSSSLYLLGAINGAATVLAVQVVFSFIDKYIYIKKG